MDQRCNFQDGDLAPLDGRLYVMCAFMWPGADSPGSTLIFCVFVCEYGHPVSGLELNRK